jgi:hypothetical protein
MTNICLKRQEALWRSIIKILENNFRLCASVIPANAGIQGELGPGVLRDDGNAPFGKNGGEMLSQSELVLIGPKDPKEKS